MDFSSQQPVASNKAAIHSKQMWRSWLIFLLYIGLTLLMTMPLITRLGTHIPAAEGSDVWIHEWTFWWIEQALLNLQNPFYTDLLFHPTGVSLTTHNIAWFNIGLWFPLQAAVGNQVAYSLTYILVFTLNAFCMYLLTFAWTRSRSAGLIAGIIYGFWPYTFTQSGHPNMATIMWPPLALFYLKRITDSGVGNSSKRWRNIAMAGLFIALTGIARWQLLIVVSLLFTIYLLYLLIRDLLVLNLLAHQRQKGRLLTWFSRIIWLAVPFLLAAVLMLPLGGPVIYTQVTQDFPEEVLVYEPWFGTPLLTYLLPNSRLGAYQWLVEQLPEHLQFHYQRVDFLGYTVLLLALIGLVGRWRHTWIWLLTALIYWTLALGPELTMAYERLPDVPMPYRLVADFPLVQIVRRPHRFNAFVALPLGLMAGYGMKILLDRLGLNAGLNKGVKWTATGNVPATQKRGRHVILTVLVAGFILAEYRPEPFGLDSTYIPNWYYELANEPEEFAIFGLPPSPRLADKYFMHYQILHQKPMVEGHISRPTNTTFSFMDQSDYLWHLRVHRVMKPELVDVTNQLQLLVDANVRYLILHKYLLTDEQLTQFVDWLTYNPFYEDDEVMVYHADPRVDRDFTVVDWLTDDVGLLGLTFGTDQVTQNVLALTEPLPEISVVQGEMVQMGVRWGSRGEMDEDLSACILLSRIDGEQATSCHALGGSWPTSSWRTSEVVRGNYTMRIPPLLEPDRYDVTLALVNSAVLDSSASSLHEAAVATRSIGEITVEGRLRLFTRPALPYQTELTWTDQIGLQAFDANVVSKEKNPDAEADVVRVTLVWQALQRMHHSYKVFVHIVDEGTGQLVAQNDSVPRQWAYPTTWWEAGEFVDDTVELSIDSSPQGALRILVGVYDEKTGIRLPVVDGEGNEFPDNAALLIVLD